MKSDTIKNHIILFVCICLGACVKDKPQDPMKQQVLLSSAKKVYVVNEGNFGTGNSSISLYDPETNVVIEDVYHAQNNTYLGDVAQSLGSVNGKFYAVVNNANKIIVCDGNFKKTGQISGLRSPRFILAVTGNKAYVSDLYADSIAIVDLNTNRKTGAIACKGKTEQMALIFNKAFVTNTERNYVYVINTATDLLTDSIEVGLNASSLVIDKNDKVWVLSSGNQLKAAARLSRIDPVNGQIELALHFDANAYPGNLCMNRAGDTLYFLNGGIYRMAVTQQALPSTAFVAKGSRNFYGLGVRPEDYSIYAADALDYSQRSNIYVFGANGEQKFTFKAGFLSNGFYFE